MSSFDRLGLRPNDPLERWRDAAEKQEREFAQAQRERKQEEQCRADEISASEAAQLRYVLEARLAALEARNAELESNVADAMRAVRYGFDTLADQRVDLTRQQREERAKGFQFAREKDVVANLPDFLGPRQVVN